MKGSMSERTCRERMMNLYRSTEFRIGETAPFLPETIRILGDLERMEAGDMDRPEIRESDRVASYRARPEPNLPFPRFHVTDVGRTLLALTGKESPGSGVLQVFRAGLQYHWHSDLTRAFEEQVLLVGRLQEISGSRELVVEHIALPLIRKHRVREIRGWFVFSQELDPACESSGRNAANMFRRTDQSWPIRPPAPCFGPERRGMMQAVAPRSHKSGTRNSESQRRRP